MGGDNLLIPAIHSRLAQLFGKFKHVAIRKQHVAGDAEQQHLGANPLPGFAIPIPLRIEQVHRPRNRQVGVGVKAFPEDLSLVFKVARNIEPAGL